MGTKFSEAYIEPMIAAAVIGVTMGSLTALCRAHRVPRRGPGYRFGLKPAEVVMLRRMQKLKADAGGAAVEVAEAAGVRISDAYVRTAAPDRLRGKLAWRIAAIRRSHALVNALRGGEPVAPCYKCCLEGAAGHLRLSEVRGGAAWLRPSAYEDGLWLCERCRAEVAEFRAGMALFGHAVRARRGDGGQSAWC